MKKGTSEHIGKSEFAQVLKRFFAEGRKKGQKNPGQNDEAEEGRVMYATDGPRSVLYHLLGNICCT